MLVKISKYLLIILLSVASFNIRAQSSTFRGMFDQLSGTNKFFLYPSTLRALGGESEEFRNMVKDIKNLKIILVDKDHEMYTNLNTARISGDVSDEGFEELMVLKDKSSVINIWENESEETLLAMVNANDSFVMMELEGKIDLGMAVKMLRTGELPSMGNLRELWETQAGNKKSDQK